MCQHYLTKLTVANLEAMHEQSDEAHEIHKFRRVRVRQEVRHEWGNQIRDAAASWSDNPCESETCLK